MAAVLFVLAFAACLVFYVYKAQSYDKTYLPHTAVNGMDVTGKTADEVKELISGDVKDYRLALQLRGGEQEYLEGSSIGLHTVFDGRLEEIIHQQNPYAWPRYLLKGPSYEIRAMIDYDRELVKKDLEAMDCFRPDLVTAPEDAQLSDYIEDRGYEIIPETEGNMLDFSKTEEAVCRAVDGLLTELDLESLGCYKAPAVTAEDESLIAARDKRNHYVNTSITYMFGAESQVLDGATIHQWLRTNEDQEVWLDTDSISGYVADLGRRYDTAYKKRSFQTSYGPTVEVSGAYGWRINQKEETAQLTALLESGETAVREPVYSQKAASRQGNDYGSTYAEVNLTAQHLYFYKEGQKLLESDFVSGNVAKGHTTPAGLFSLTYKQRDAVLRGEGYASPVKYWMPFNGGIGFHDASWRSSFGGAIYKTGGSHGCINMPYAAAKTLFENVYAGMPVICYNLPGTESKKTSNAAGASEQTVKPTQPAAPAKPVQTEAQSVPPAQQIPETQPPAKTEPAPETSPQQSAPQETAAQPEKPSVLIETLPEGAGSGGPGVLPQGEDAYGPAFQNR